MLCWPLDKFQMTNLAFLSIFIIPQNVFYSSINLLKPTYVANCESHKKLRNHQTIKQDHMNIIMKTNSSFNAIHQLTKLTQSWYPQKSDYSLFTHLNRAGPAMEPTEEKNRSFFGHSSSQKWPTFPHWIKSEATMNEKKQKKRSKIGMKMHISHTIRLCVPDTDWLFHWLCKPVFAVCKFAIHNSHSQLIENKRIYIYFEWASESIIKKILKLECQY